MKKTLHFLMIVVFASFLLNAYSQGTITTKGRIVTLDGEPIAGSTIEITNVKTGTKQKVVADDAGVFTVGNLSSSASYSIRVIHLGYQEEVVNDFVVAENNNNSLLIRLKPNQSDLDEVVVIGYGTAKKKDLTGAISSIKAESLSAQAPRNVQDLLRSNAAGLQVGIGTDAKAESSVGIRGDGSLTASNNPLIVLDNVIYDGAMSDINPNDIATIDVLKDASSAAVYGSRSANGVIVITTKRGKVGKPLINVVASNGFASSANQPKILDPAGFLSFRKDYNEGRVMEEYLQKYPEMFVDPTKLGQVDQLSWYNYDQATPVTAVTADQLTTKWLSRLNFSTPEIENYFAGNITKWDDLVFQRAFQQDYNVSVSNSSEYVSQYISAGYTDREGIIVGDRYKNLRARVNVESKVTSYLTTGVNVQFASRDEGYLKANWSQMTMISPYGANHMDDLTSKYRRRPTGLDPINPFYDNAYTNREQLNQNLNAIVYAKIKLPFGIEYNVNFNPYLNWYNYYNHYSSQGENWSALGGSADRNLSKTYNWQVDNILRWNKVIQDDHKVEVTLLANAEKGQYWSTSTYAYGFTPNDNLGYHFMNAGATATVKSNDTYKTADALMGRIFYSYKDKYLLTSSVRRDGYSAFGKKNPRSLFAAVALGWVFSEEQFFDNTGLFNYGKLRFSWGENGNREIGQYAALSQMQSSLLPYLNAAGNFFTTSQIYVTTMANYNLKWERTGTYNLGLDFGLFNNRLTGALEGYVATTNDLLMERSLPNITGFSDVMSNLGRLSNRGVELTLNATPYKTEDLAWQISGNFSFNRRKIKSLYGDMISIVDEKGNVIETREADDESNQWFIGQDPDRIWAYQRDGVWQYDEADLAKPYGLQPGDFKYLDQNGDGVMNNKDKVFQGYKTPRFRWSLRNEVSYKNFDFSFVLYSYLKYYGAFQRAANTYSFPDRTSDYDFPRWTKDNPIDDYARIGSKNIGTNWVNKSFVRLENVTLSYNVPKSVLNKLEIQNLRLNLTMQNLGVLANDWSFWDPESETVTPRTINFGINLTL
ncbi:SusC/RagA family TonB-linked outer membrane protein [Sphingobacterium sp. DK4209]|uniref:SusC/RagA family TonB-linked outer membrane protein n=1 Tax=Sphingobacterium zhuxiongii TaxID=2662364 RepID=A0A5Q0Q8F4_9SPHI|nr:MULTISPECIES: SusC/RagA family TonB-linked outer membrane protein [unclassified Sphingobacterium]MVZ65242.1 SusC/RagA family TonB-linked outer membrane protein [Sphingobacterium sp. DK4209]QGA26337.1 SusC/RagA family TonB-linked outer membrane protein [Sphingobacterium sp. dk4302]